jgi:hypothetical protein
MDTFFVAKVSSIFFDEFYILSAAARELKLMMKHLLH